MEDLHFSQERLGNKDEFPLAIPLYASRRVSRVDNTSSPGAQHFDGHILVHELDDRLSHRLVARRGGRLVQKRSCGYPAPSSCI